MEDNTIIQLFFNRSEQAIIAVEDQYGAYCRSILRNILVDPEEQEECMNDVLMKLWNQIPPHRPDCLRAFIGAVARNLALDRYRASRAEKRGSGMAEIALSELGECAARETVEDALEEHRLVELLNSFLARLPRESRVIFVKRYWYLSPVRQIAEETGCTEGKVKMSLHRTRKQLRQFLEKEDIAV